MIGVQTWDYRAVLASEWLILYVANQERKCLANIIRPSTSKPLILAKPGPSQASPETVIRALHTTHKRHLLKPASSSLSSTEGQN